MCGLRGRKLLNSGRSRDRRFDEGPSQRGVCGLLASKILVEEACLSHLLVPCGGYIKHDHV